MTKIQITSLTETDRWVMSAHGAPHIKEGDTVIAEVRSDGYAMVHGCVIPPSQFTVIQSKTVHTLDEFQRLASRTANVHAGPQTDHLANFALGLTGEAGEVADMVKKHIFHGHRLDETEMKKELGDVLWYVSQLAEVLGMDLSDIADMNIKKLQKRYPLGFSEQDSQNRKDV